MGHINKNNHKARHGGYRHKSTQREVSAQHSFWRGLNDVAKEIHVNQIDVVPEGTQLKLKF